MVHERNNKFDEDEEIEYHFSDDQINYEMDSDTVKPASGPSLSRNYKETIIEGFNKHRRILLSVLGFFILIFIVYKMLIPSSTQPTEITQSTPIAQPVNNAPSQPAARPMPPAPYEQQLSAPNVQQPAQQMPQQQHAQPIMQASVEAGQQSVMMPAQNPTSPPQQYSMPPQPGVTQVASVPANTPPVTETSTVEQKNMVDRLAALEDQNAKLMSLLQTQFAQKIADYEDQTKAVQERVVVLNKRLSNIEASINKMAQLIQEEGMSKAPKMAAHPPTLPSGEPKISYVVQAIIPGRAWLKSDAGDTVTVAENDSIKDFGRVVKIDPYDGVVEIDIGNKVIALSYGSGSD